MQTTLQRVTLPDDRRILMISDLHGHADGLRAVLKKAGFSKDDVLIIVGDLIEKGPQSLDTLRLVMDLCRTHAVYPLMGNVDLWRLEYLQSQDPDKWREMAGFSLHAIDWWGGSLMHELCAEMGEPLTEHTDVSSVFPEIQRRFETEIRFLESLPTILETQRMIFVHGGIPHENLAALEGQDAYPLLKWDDFYHTDLSFQKYVAVGHTPAVLYSKTFPDFSPVIDRQRRIISLDGACGVKREGQLNLVTLPHWDSEDFSLITWDHLPQITALDGQEPSSEEDAVYIRWSDHQVELIRRGEEISRVLYHGKKIDVPSSFLFEQNGKLCCTDATDYRLNVKPGDQLLAVLPLSIGCLVKKDGVEGWYLGRYQQNEVKEP